MGGDNRCRRVRPALVCNRSGSPLLPKSCALRLMRVFPGVPAGRGKLIKVSMSVCCGVFKALEVSLPTNRRLTVVSLHVLTFHLSTPQRNAVVGKTSNKAKTKRNENRRVCFMVRVLQNKRGLRERLGLYHKARQFRIVNRTINVPNF